MFFVCFLSFFLYSFLHFSDLFSLLSVEGKGLFYHQGLSTGKRFSMHFQLEVGGFSILFQSVLERLRHLLLPAGEEVPKIQVLHWREDIPLDPFLVDRLLRCFVHFRIKSKNDQFSSYVKSNLGLAEAAKHKRVTRTLINNSTNIFGRTTFYTKNISTNKASPGHQNEENNFHHFSAPDLWGRNDSANHTSSSQHMQKACAIRLWVKSYWYLLGVLTHLWKAFGAHWR